MIKQDWVTKQLKAYGFNVEKSNLGYWVEIDWDYSGESRWELFSSYDSIMSYLQRNGMIGA